jgi:hypothetical protein
MLLNASGNVGINNTSPTELLDVNGNIKCTGTITTTGTKNANGNKLNFPNTLDQYKINLRGTNNYGFGIAASTLQYTSQGNHSFIIVLIMLMHPLLIVQVMLLVQELYKWFNHIFICWKFKNQWI